MRTTPTTTFDRDDAALTPCLIARSVQELQESAPSQEPRKIRVDVADIKERVNRRAAAQEARMVERLRSRQPPKALDAPPAAAVDRAAARLRGSARQWEGSGRGGESRRKQLGSFRERIRRMYCTVRVA